MSHSAISATLTSEFGDSVNGGNVEATDPWVEVEPDLIADVCRFLRDEPSLAFDTLSDLCGVDYLETDPKLLKKFPYDPHTEVVYHLASVRRRHRLVLKVIVPRPLPDQLPEVPSVCDVWPAADWHERECYDLFGIRFTGHPNLTRLLCPDDWVGHPLRKDYEQPLEYDGIRGR